jgi:hypothetical protein
MAQSCARASEAAAEDAVSMAMPSLMFSRLAVRPAFRKRRNSAVRWWFCGDVLERW